MNSMVNQIFSLPELIKESLPEFDKRVKTVLGTDLCGRKRHIFIVGCGDSHHAALNTEMAFESLSGLQVEPLTAMQFARFGVGYIPRDDLDKTMCIGVSASGEVARTIEAIQLANKAGIDTVAITANTNSQLASISDRTLVSAVSPFPDPPDIHTPGIRSFTASQLMLFLMAIHFGQMNSALDVEKALKLKAEIEDIALACQKTIELCEGISYSLAQNMHGADDFVFVGCGPNYGTALFLAAKIIESCGDPALGQDTEEWAHLQYFVEKANTPTFIISTGGRDLSRSSEIAIAAKTIGHRVISISPHSSETLNQTAYARLPYADRIRECFSPMVSVIPGELFAAYRAEIIGAKYFRDFGGGRSREEGGGISRIRSSQLISEFPE